MSLSSSLNLARDIIPIAIGINPTDAYALQKPNLYENSPAAINNAITYANEMTERFLGIKNLNVSDQMRIHAKEHATGHQIRFPGIRNSMHKDIIEYPRNNAPLVER